MTALATDAAPPEAAERLAAGRAMAGKGPKGPAVRLCVVVRMRPAWVWTGIIAFAAMSALCAVGAWMGDARMPGAAALHAAAATLQWWYLRYPVGLYEPTSNTFVEVLPFGLAWRRRPGAGRGGGLALRGDRIVEADRPWRTVIAGAFVREGDWRTVARSVRRSPACPSAPGPADRPGFITPRQRRAGLAVAVVAVAALIHLAATSLTSAASETGAEHGHDRHVSGRHQSHRSPDGPAADPERGEPAAMYPNLGNQT